MDEDHEHGGVTPLFVKHKELGLHENEQLTVFQFCKELFKNGVTQDSLEGAQRIRGLWRVYFTTTQSRDQVYANDFVFRGKTVQTYQENPFLDNRDNKDHRQTTKVSIQQLPLSVSNNVVENMLKNLGCKYDGNIQFECERDEHGKLTMIKNGNRFVFADKKIEENPLPRFTYCGNWRIRIYHKGQTYEPKKCFKCLRTGHLGYNCPNERVCRSCEQEGHKEGDETCPYFLKNDVVTFKGHLDPLSNFFPCNIVWKESDMTSSEQVYGYEMAVSNARPDIASDIIRASTAKEVKELSKKVYRGAQWEKQKVPLMKNILRAKVEQVPEVRDNLLKTGERTICETLATDTFWSCGLDREAAENTATEHWPGQNVMGNLWMEIRKELIAEMKNAKQDLRQTSRGHSKEQTNQNSNSNKVNVGKRKPSGDAGGIPATKQKSNSVTPPKNSGRSGKS